MPEASRPVRLTFPAREPGARRIMANGVQVGHVLADHRMRWTAYLWLDAGQPGRGFASEVYGPELSRLRGVLREWVKADGAWWSETAATR